MLIFNNQLRVFKEHLNRYPSAICRYRKPAPLLPRVVCPEDLFERALVDAFSGSSETIPVSTDQVPLEMSQFTVTSLTDSLIFNSKRDIDEHL